MTIEEKLAQLVCIARAHEADWLLDESGRPDTNELIRRYPLGFGQLGRPSLYLSPAGSAEATTAIQGAVATHTRLGIGVLFNEEGVHGHMASGATYYPAAIALASTWDPVLVERVYEAVAAEVRARGSNYVYAPVLDLARDPRWGRVEETFGEDPYLVGRLGVAAVSGLQGRDWEIPADRVLACVKHYAGHGAPEAGVNAAPLHAGKRELREEHLAPFEMVISNSLPGAVMVAYHEIDGIPCHANDWLLNEVLRKDFGFEGMVSSDGHGVTQLATEHHVAADISEAGRLAIVSGVDCEVPEPACFPTLLDQVDADPTVASAIDRAARNVLMAKDRLGLLDAETRDADPEVASRLVNGENHQELALEAARRSLTLLHNQDGGLPLDTSKLGKLAVIGPHALHSPLGGYTDESALGKVSVFDALTSLLPDVEVVHARGCRVTVGRGGPSAWWTDDEISLRSAEAQLELIAEAVSIAADADVVVLVIGGDESTAREGWSTDHLGDRDSIALPGAQVELVEAIVGLDTPAVAVVTGGRPLDLTRVVDGCAAVVQAWYPGQEGGMAIAEVLLGRVNPSGKLPITIPRSVGQVPMNARLRPSSHRGYLFSSNEPLFAFGHGLSFTSFVYTALTIDPQEIAVGETVEVAVDVTNTGERDGAEVVQCYVSDLVASVTRPRQSLRGFRRVELERGEARTVRFELGIRDLALVDRDMEWRVEPGEFRISVGGSSKTSLHELLTVR